LLSAIAPSGVSNTGTCTKKVKAQRSHAGVHQNKYLGLGNSRKTNIYIAEDKMMFVVPFQGD
jgi:hypothetical protein